MTLEEIREAKKIQQNLDCRLTDQFLFTDKRIEIEDICIELANKYFDTKPGFLVYAEVSGDDFKIDLSKELEKAFKKKSDDLKYIESIEYYGIKDIIFNGK